MKKILVTGNLGFIGSSLVKRLRTEGFQVRGIDRKPAKGIDYPHSAGDILNPDAVHEAMESVDCVIHLAAEHRDFGIDRESYFRVNEGGTRVLLQEAERRNISTFIFFSSVAVYGDQQGTTEATSPQPVTPYGESKVAAEKVLREWTLADPARKSVVIRPTVVFGPRNTANIFKLIRQVCDGRFVWVGHGNLVKSIAYVENLVDATLFLLELMKPGLQVYNYADSPHLTTHELVSLIAMKSGQKVPRLHIPVTAAIAVAKLFDVVGNVTGHDFPITSARLKKFNAPTFHRAEKIRQEGFSPRFSIEEGIEENVRWYMGEKLSRTRIDHTSE